jgi:hypothetical protein
MTSLLSIGMAPEMPIMSNRPRPRNWRKVPASKKIKFMPLSIAEFVSKGKKKGKYKVTR